MKAWRNAFIIDGTVAEWDVMEVDDEERQELWITCIKGADGTWLNILYTKYDSLSQYLRVRDADRIWDSRFGTETEYI